MPDRDDPDEIGALRRELDAQRRLTTESEFERAWLEDALKVAKVGSWQTDLDTLTVKWSAETYRIFGLDRATFRPTHLSFLERVHPEDAAAVDAAFRASFGTREVCTISHRILLDDGTVKQVEERWRTFVDDAGQPLRAMGTCQDITERKQLEAHVLRAQRMESIGTLAGGIAHDLNNVLTPIIASIDMLRRADDDPGRRESLDTIALSASRGAEMVQRVLAFARGARGDRVSVDAGRVAGELAKVVTETFPKNITIDLERAAGPLLVQADGTQIHQLLLNLCVNARDAMPRGGTLRIGLRREALAAPTDRLPPGAPSGDYVRIEVADTGTGMAPALVERIFEPFFTTKDTGQGSGLGLATVHSIVRGHGGFVEVDSTLGKGSRFTVWLPASTTPVAPTPRAPSTPGAGAGRGELVLVVDDEAAIRRVAQRMLERNGYRVLLAADGAEAVRLFAARHAEVALVLTDMAMPQMDGPATVLALRGIDPAVRIVGTSGETSDGELTRLAGAKVHAFLPKPYAAEALLTIVRQVLDQD